MIYIFHGDDLYQSRQALDNLLSTHRSDQTFRLESKEITPDKIENFLSTPSLFSLPKILILVNPFSLPKPTQDKIIPIISKTSDDIFIWQDKLLTATQLKAFSKPKVTLFRLPNDLFASLNAVKPNNLKIFLPLFYKTIKSQAYDLYLYLLKANLRKQLTTGYSRFPQGNLKTTYLQLLELDYQTKTGQLVLPKEIALERIMIQLLS